MNNHHPFRTLLSAMLITASLAVVGGLTAQPASATPTLSGVRVVYGDRTLTTTWSPLSGATGYRIEYASHSDMSGSKLTPVTTNTYQVVSALTNERTYHLRLRAYTGNRELTRTTLTATPQSGYPAVMPKVTIVPGSAPNQVRVSWSRLQRATRVMVLAGADNHQSISYFHSSWLPATATTTTLTVPRSYRYMIGSGSGNPIYVKVGQYNSATATTIRTERNLAANYRLSFSNVYGFATPLAITGGTHLKVASYNIQSVAASDPGHPWSERKPRVTANIALANPDLIGLQEADSAVSMNYQHRQMAVELAPHGYVMSGDLPANYRFNNDVTEGWFYYKIAVLSRLSGGILSPRDDLNISWPSGMGDRRGTWAKFQVRATGRIFYAIDMHLPAGGSTALRTREVAALSSYIQDRAQGAPIVFVGDLNAAVMRDGYCAASKLHSLGWYDTASTLNRTHKDLQTANSPVGYPSVPERALNVNTGRIDYIFTKNMGGGYRYENREILTSDGHVDTRYQGSDHNLQMATLGL